MLRFCHKPHFHRIIVNVINPLLQYLVGIQLNLEVWQVGTVAGEDTSHGRVWQVGTVAGEDTSHEGEGEGHQPRVGK